MVSTATFWLRRSTQLWQRLNDRRIIYNMKKTKKSRYPGLFSCYPYSADNFCTASAEIIITQCSSRKASMEESAFSGEPYSESML